MKRRSPRASYLSVDQMHDLDHACRLLTASFGFSTFIVGSVLQTSRYRDVDLRCILDDSDFDAFFGNATRLRLLNAALSQWIQARTGLPVDFQFQRRTDANKDFDGPRQFIGRPLDPHGPAIEHQP